MAEINNMLVVINPAYETQPAVTRAAINAGNSKSGQSKITFLVAQDPNYPAPLRNQSWLQDILKPVIEKNIDHDVVFDWGHDWADAIMAASEACGASNVLISYYENVADKKVLSDDLWYLLRNTKVSVVLVKNQEREVIRKTILLSMNMQNEEYKALNEKILQLGRWVADSYDATLHVVNAYKDSMDYPDRSKALETTGVAQENLHLKLGKPETVIAQVASDISADLVLLGTARRTGLKAALRGNTIEKIVEKVHCDLGALVE